MMRRHRLAVAVVALALVAAACGDGDDSGSNGADEPRATAAGTEAAGQPTEPAGDPQGGAFDNLTGTYEGAWSNETFQTTAEVTIELAVEGNAATFTLTLTDGPDGSPFGIAAPEPKVLEGTVIAGDLAVELLGDELFGDLSALITAGGEVAVTASMDGVPGVSGLTVTGTITEAGMDLRYTVSYPDGTEASGTATLTKT